MSDIYAIFKSEDSAERAIKKITDYDKDIRISMFDSDLSITDDGILFKDADIIGSPSGMISQGVSSGNLSDPVSFPQTELVPFLYADFIITEKNSLASPSRGKTDFPHDNFSTGLCIKAPTSQKNSVKKILKSEDATLIKK